jgi:hypothetical protein
MLFLKIYLCWAIVLDLNCQPPQNKNIVVTGKALDAKAGAVVVSDDKGIFYIDGLPSWSKEFYGKKVKVTGKLITENGKNNNADTTKPLVQEIAGPTKIIKNAKWEIVK